MNVSHTFLSVAPSWLLFRILRRYFQMKEWIICALEKSGKCEKFVPLEAKALETLIDKYWILK